MINLRILFIASIMTVSLALSGCGGSGGSSTTPTTTDTSTTISTEEADAADGTLVVAKGATGIETLDMASRVSVVDSTASASSIAEFGLAKAILRAIDTDAFSATVDYNVDQTEVWVNDRSVEAFGTPNEILCMIEQTRTDLMVNQGPYIAQINSELCEARETGSGGQQEGTGQESVDVPDYEYWVVNVLRADENSPQVVEAWIPESEDGGDGGPSGIIFARIVVTKDRDEVPPFGVFTMNFKILPFATGSEKEADLTAESDFSGMMKSFVNTAGENLLAFTNFGEMDEEIEGIPVTIEVDEKVIMAKNTNGGRGAASMADFDFGPGGFEQIQEEFNIAYNDNYFMRQYEGDEAKCFDRANPNRNAWRYGVYDSTGDRVEISSGIQVGYASGDEVIQGWAGYWGVNFYTDNGEVDISTLDGQTVYAFDWADYDLDTSESYTINVFPGKLRKVVKETTNLSKIQDVQLNYWDNATGDEYRVSWDGTKFAIDAIRDSNWYWDEDTSDSEVDMSALQWPDLYFWSEQLNGNVRIQIDGCTESNVDDMDWSNDSFDCSGVLDDDHVTVTFYAETEVLPGDSVATALDGVALSCYQNCPDPTQLDDQANQYIDHQSGNWDSSTAYTYIFDEASMSLYKDSVATANKIAFPADAPEGMWGISTGALVPTADITSAMIQCDWDNTQTCGWMLESTADAFYRWETGKDSWNKLVSIEDASNNVVAFQQPLNLKYEHAANGKTYMLQYEGFGNLWGIPEQCFDGETGTEIDCPWNEMGWDGEYDGWLQMRNEITIPAGALATYKNASGTTVEVVIKALEEEHYMRVVDTANCTADGLAIVDYTEQFINLDNWVDPTSDGMMGQVPAASELVNNGDPAIVDGELATGYTPN